MTFLHILRSEPIAQVKLFIKGLASAGAAKEVPLYQGTVNYDQLVKEIFQADRVICWW
jgi:hypothetical protein